MKIGVSNLAFYPETFKRILEYLEAQGVGFCEIINEYPYNEIDEDVLESYDVKLTVHAPL